MANKKSETAAKPANKRIYLNNYPKSLCREHEGASRPFMSISFQMTDLRWASFIVPTGLERNSLRRDGTIIENCITLPLGEPSAKRLVSVACGDTFEDVTMTNQEIYDSVIASREAFQVANA